jgi:transglutaminase-like putative cysteine protease/pimeloyl-ACP methyl ester carboxylesterase
MTTRFCITLFRAWRSVALAILWLTVFNARAAEGGAPGPWWSPAVEQALAQAGANREALVKVLSGAPERQRASLEFLVRYMPAADLRALPADWLSRNAALALQARDTVAWGKSVPQDLFDNDVLPYAVMDEVREDWRQKLYDLCLPLVRECQTPGEAARKLNQTLFGLVKVKYSTEREKPNQNPTETMSSGIATCTGLSILLVDACRAVAIPARVAGTPMWANGSGNHTWVEVWDQGWHFLGAAEPDPNGLDRGWFVHNASQALRDKPENAIYASSYKATGVFFPLSWAPDQLWVPAWNVTGRYAAAGKSVETNQLRLLVRVYDHPAGKRVTANIQVSRAGGESWDGTSLGETADMNDDLAFRLAKGETYSIRMELGGVIRGRTYQAGTNAEDLITFCLGPNPDLAGSPARYEPPKVTSPLAPRVEREFAKELAAYFLANADQRANWRFPARFERLLKNHEAAVKQLAWRVYSTSPIHEVSRRDFESRQVRFGEYLSPYTVKTVGARPSQGWALFIAMHGGGNAPKEVNDSQWADMRRYYRDHPEVGGYRYVALRAPNDSWNGFYDNYVYPLVANLIRHFLIFGDVDPNKVFIMGYSHGGYGAFAIGPKIPDRFAAIHASAAAPTDGETTAKTLRNTVFTFMVGGKDTQYGRLDRCVQFDKEVRQLRGGNLEIYPVTFQLIEGNGHTGLPDRDKIVDLYPQTRNPVPRELTWLMTDPVVQNFFWLRVAQPAKKREINAALRDNRLDLTTANPAGVSVLLDRRLADFNRPITAVINGKTRTYKVKPSLRVLGQTLLERGDPDLAFTARLDVP